MGLSVKPVKFPPFCGFLGSISPSWQWLTLSFQSKKGLSATNLSSDTSRLDLGRQSSQEANRPQVRRAVLSSADLKHRELPGP